LKNRLGTEEHVIVNPCVAEPEPVERQLFAGAKAEIFWLAAAATAMQIHINFYKKNLIFCILKIRS
jgi:hypothetical protein